MHYNMKRRFGQVLLEKFWAAVWFLKRHRRKILIMLLQDLIVAVGMVGAVLAVCAVVGFLFRILGVMA